MWNGFDFYFYLDRIIRIFSPAARGLSAKGRLILTILLILSNYFLYKRIHSSFCYYCILLHLYTFDFFDQLRQNNQGVADDTQIGDFKYRGIGVLVYGNDLLR